MLAFSQKSQYICVYPPLTEKRARRVEVKSRAMDPFKVLFALSMGLIFLFQLHGCLDKYLNPVIVTVTAKTSSKAMTFPDLTICKKGLKGVPESQVESVQIPLLNHFCPSSLTGEELMSCMGEKIFGVGDMVKGIYLGTTTKLFKKNHSETEDNLLVNNNTILSSVESLYIPGIIYGVCYTFRFDLKLEPGNFILN